MMANPYKVTRETWLKEWPVLVLLVLDLGFAIWVRPDLPEQVPVQWGANGAPTRYGDPWSGALLLPVVNVAVYLYLLYGPMFNARLAQYAASTGMYRLLRWGTVVVVAAVHLSMMLLMRRGA